ncbi:MAG: amidohydrolase family protein [Acidimicrobiaceae bacterium]|nr:amidohydrolase family protein [Acidimicrobiaceae bacterium]MYF34638.1 amidohydrolase family protein [Acidimicrobiaceae bacterium]
MGGDSQTTQMTGDPAAAEPVTMLVEGTVVTMDPDRRIISDGAVAVAGDRIAAVGKADELRSRHPDALRIGGARRYVIPGLIDCHNHIAQALCRESTVEDFPNIYRIYIPAEDIQDTDDVRVSAQVAFAQLLRAGVTTMTETTCTVAHEEPIAETVMETGIRCALARGMWDRESRLAGNYEQITEKSWYRDDPALLADDLAYTEEFFKKWFERGKGRLRPWVHNLGVPSCSDERYLATDEMVQQWGTGIMTHINRDREEIELSVSLFGHRPLEHLASIGALTERLVAIHAMLTTDREIDLMAEAGAKLAHAPVVCTDIMSAVTRVPLMRARGITVGLGCDTIINDLLKLMRIAHIMHNQAAMPLFDPYGFSCNDAFEMGTIDAARLLMWDDEIGSLEEGKAADICVIDANNVRLTPSTDPVATLVRYGVGTDAESTIVAGELVMHEGRLLTIDEEALLGEAEALGARMIEEMAPRRYVQLGTNVDYL